jgi:exosome complex component RRP40
MTTFESNRVLPGDDVTMTIAEYDGIENNKVELGNGLRHHRNRVVCTCAGTLKHRAPAHYFVEEKNKKQYYPREGDQVVGVIEDRGGEVYRVNIFSGIPAVMSRLAFDGATKRNRPELKKGDIVYCRVLSARLDTDVELSCMATTGIKKDWSSGEATYQGLGEGIICRTTILFAEKLLHPQCPVLNQLGGKVAFELAIGANGIVWVAAQTISESVLVKNVIENANSLDDEIQQVAMVDFLTEKTLRR